MIDYEINFATSPWFLLIIIASFTFTFILYFRFEKKYRRSNHRVLSVVLHSLVMVMCILVLSGIYISYDTKNFENELVILVDSSFSTNTAKESANNFIHEILVENEGRSQIAIVKFGYDQVIAVEMGDYDAEDAYNKYLLSKNPNTSATNISGALTFVYNPFTDKSGGDGNALIHYPDSAKILLISDGLQTDQDAMSVAKLISMCGIKIDTTFYPGTYQNDISIIDVVYPERKLTINETFDFSVTLRSTFSDTIKIYLTDKNENGISNYEWTDLEVGIGIETINLPYTFDSVGHHELKFNIESSSDVLKENNVFYTYYDINVSNRILIIEKYDGESNALKENILNNHSSYQEVTVIDIDDIDKVPNSVDELSKYEEIILVNIAHSDMPKGFEDILNEYVSIRGGGLFTIGGFDRDDDGNIIMEEKNGVEVPKQHSYLESDMKNTLYENMLPVDAVNYKPSIGLAIIIDKSNSMDYGGGNESLLDIALNGAVKSLDALSNKDYVSITVLRDSYSDALDWTPMTQKQSIISTIRSISDGEMGGTRYAPAIDRAGKALSTFDGAEKKHILLLSDGAPSDKADDFCPIMQNYHDNYGITITVVSIRNAFAESVDKLAKAGGGNAYILDNSTISTLPKLISDDLKLDELSGLVETQFSPTINQHTSIVDEILSTQLESIKLNGYFITKPKSTGDVSISLMAEYVPLYAQWQYGNGKVGSFMCDLSGYWSNELIGIDVGETIINNIVSSIMSTVQTQDKTLEATVFEDNYHTKVNVYNFNGYEEPNNKLVAIIQSSSMSECLKYDLSSMSTIGNSLSFEIFEPGIHEVIIIKVSRSFNIFDSQINSIEDISSSEILGIFKTYRILSYSKEYDSSRNPFDEGKELLIKLSTRESDVEDEKLIYDPSVLLSDFQMVHREWNPRILLICLSIIFFLLDIAIRKFNFCWPHEIIKHIKKRRIMLGVNNANK